MAIKFHTAYGEKPPRVPSHPGSKYETKYVERLDQNGNRVLKVDPTEPEVNVYEKIQSYADTQEIHQLIARYKMGDLSAVKERGVYMDSTQMPSNFHEAYNLVQEQKKRFMELPLEVRNQFGNDFELWASQAGNAEWLKKMGFKQDKQEENVPRETKEGDVNNGES